MAASIREMTPEDYREVREIWESTPGMRLEQADSEEGVAKYLSRNPHLSYVAVSGERIVGTVLCGEDGRRGYLQHLCVLPEFQGQGVGKRLVDSAVAQFQRLGLYEVRIFIFRNNDIGNEFWERSGWTVRDDIFVRAFNLEK